jgi:type I restriction enzyme M protein
VIVPEGIIFQGQNAYKSLRRMLVENYIWAVVSLPAGVFNPYSGVKTSILSMDRNLAKRTDNVLFVKVENDGFGLGAQRRPIEGSQLAEALAILERHKKTPAAQEGKMALTIPRTRLLESPDINLSGDRYRAVAVRHTCKWPMVRLGEIAEEIRSGFACGPDQQASKGVPHFRPMNISEAGEFVWNGTKFIKEAAFGTKQEYALRSGDVLFNNTNSKELVGKTCLVPSDILAGYSNHITRVRVDRQRISPRLLALLLHYLWQRGVFMGRCNKWVGQAAINNHELAATEIPLPPLVEQERIVAELEEERKLVDANRELIRRMEARIKAKLDEVWGG